MIKKSYRCLAHALGDRVRVVVAARAHGVCRATVKVVGERAGVRLRHGGKLVLA